MHDCWLEDPDDRPNFSYLATSITEVVIQPQIEHESLESLKRNYNPEAARNVLDCSLSISEFVDAV